MAKFKMNVLVDSANVKTARLSNVASSTAAGDQMTKLENGKLVKLIGDSQFGLCAQGDEIEGFIVVANDPSPQDGFNLGSVCDEGRFLAVADGLQATPGTGTIAIGDFVVAGTVTALGTALATYPKVCKATATKSNIVFGWRVVSILTGTGVVGDTLVVEEAC